MSLTGPRPGSCQLEASKLYDSCGPVEAGRPTNSTHKGERRRQCCGGRRCGYRMVRVHDFTLDGRLPGASRSRPQAATAKLASGMARTAVENFMSALLLLISAPTIAMAEALSSGKRQSRFPNTRKEQLQPTDWPVYPKPFLHTQRRLPHLVVELLDSVNCRNDRVRQSLSTTYRQAGDARPHGMKGRLTYARLRRSKMEASPKVGSMKIGGRKMRRCARTLVSRTKG
jgi:hypothetical protein